MKRKRKEKKPYLTTKTTNYTSKDGEKSKIKTTKVRGRKTGNLYKKTTYTKVGKAERGDVVKRVVKSVKPPNKKQKTKITTIHQGKKGRIVKKVRKDNKEGYLETTSVKNMPKKKIDRLKEAYRKVMRKKKRKKY